MEMKIISQTQLVSVLYSTLLEYDNCVVELKDKRINEKLLFISSEISNDKVLLSMCTVSAGKSVGDIVNKYDNKTKYNWAQLNCSYINFDHNSNIVATLPDKIENPFLEDGYYNIDFKREYNEKHNKMKDCQCPVRIYNVKETLEYFDFFLKNKKCSKIIISFDTMIPDLNHKVVMDFIIDKIFIRNRSFISFTVDRPDITDIEILSDLDDIYDYNFDEDDSLGIVREFYKIINNIYRMMLHISDEKVNINVYSNCKLN